MHGSFVWKPKEFSRTYNAKYHFNGSNFSKEAFLLGTFHYIHGKNDAGPVPLSAVGWDEMMTNIVKIELFYDKTADEE